MSKPRNGYRPASARQSHAGQMNPIATCPECGKRAYTSKTSAKRTAKWLHPGDRMRVYQCPGAPWWHLTSQDAVKVAETRAWLAGSGGPGSERAARG